MTQSSNSICFKNDCPNGQNINKDCGSTYLENDKNKEKRLILALDGDGDRFIGSYNSYKIDGEILCYLLINLYNDKFKNGIVSTPLTNRKIVQAITKEGIPYYESKVGDSNVFDLMIKKHCKFGFEASGHLLFSSYSDGILSSLIFLSLLEKDYPLFTSRHYMNNRHMCDKYKIEKNCIRIFMLKIKIFDVIG